MIDGDARRGTPRSVTVKGLNHKFRTGQPLHQIPSFRGGAQTNNNPPVAPQWMES